MRVSEAAPVSRWAFARLTGRAATLLLGVLSAQAAFAQPSAPFVPRAGDVYVNAPLGVVKHAPATPPVQRLLASPTLGVSKPRPDPPAEPLHVVSDVVGIHRGPGLASVDPDRLEIGQFDQTLTIEGVALDAVVAAAIQPPDHTQITSFEVEADGQRIHLLIDVDPDAVAGLRRIELFDAASKRVPVLVDGGDALLLAANLPHIDSVTPSLAETGRVHHFEIRGRNLRGLPYIEAMPSPLPEVIVTPADGLVLDRQIQVNDSGTLVEIRIEVLADASLEPRLVQIATASGISSSLPTPANTFRLAETTPYYLTPFVSSALGVRKGNPTPIERESFVVSTAINVHRGRVITALSPEHAVLGEHVSLRMEGSYLGDALGVVISPDDGIDVDEDTVSISADRIEFAVDIAPDASLVPRRISVLFPDGELDAPHLLELRTAAPVVTALSPTFVIRDGSSQVIQIQGERLSQTTGARILPDDTGFVIESYVPHGAERATLQLRATAAAALGERVVQLLGPDEPSSPVPTPGNRLIVSDRDFVLTPFVSPSIGVLKQVEIEPPVHEMDLSSPAVAVLKGAVAQSVQPNLLPRGGSRALTISGRGLDAVANVAIEDADGLILGDPQIATDGRSINVEVAVAIDATLGLRRFTLRTEDDEVIPFVPAESALVSILESHAAAPIAYPDRYDVHANQALTVAAVNGVLINDIDPHGGSLTAVLRRLPANGILSLDHLGGFTYTPNPDFVGEDRFEYSASNGELVGNATVVTLTVREFDRPAPDSYATNKNETLTITGAAGILSNDQLASDGPVEIVLDTAPGLGQLDLAQDGSFVYQPNGIAGIDGFRYRLRGDQGLSLPAQVTITIHDVNQHPVASDDYYVIERGLALSIAAPGVLANDADPDGDPLAARPISQPAVGSLVLNSNGGMTYTPPADFVGDVSFHYEAVDPDGLASQAEVRIVVNDSLAPRPDFYDMNEGEVLFVDSDQGVLANDSIVGTGTVRAVLVQGSDLLGTINLDEDGAFVFTPIDPDVHGEAVFIYRLEDDTVISPPASVTITIHPVNDASVAVPDSYLTDENAELNVEAPGVLANDTDVDSDIGALVAELVLQPENGVVVLSADGGFSYVPDVNYRGPDRFEYIVRDDQGEASEPTEVTIDVTQPPTATNDVYMLEINETLEIIDPQDGLLVNDHDAPENDPLTAILVGPPDHGHLELNDDGTFVYVPDLDFQGLDNFSYQATDTRSVSNVATVTLAVGITGIPKAVPDFYEMMEDGELHIPADEGVLINDLDSDTPIEDLEAYLVGSDSMGRVSLDVTVNLDGSFRVKPWPNFYGETFFVYQAYDGTQISNAAIVRITVHPVNDGVEAEDDHFGVIRNTVYQAIGWYGIRRNDSWDPDFPVAFELVEPPQTGLIDFQSNGDFTYTPQQDFAGEDSFVYRLYQVDTGIGDLATVTLRVNAPPVPVPDFYQVDEDSVTLVSPGPLANDYDPDGDPIELTRNDFGGGTNYVRIEVDDVSDPAVATITSGNNFYGEREVLYRITDGTSQESGTITVTVNPVPDDPIAKEDNYLTNQNTVLVISNPAHGVLGNDFDPDTRPAIGYPVWAAATGPDLLPLRAQVVAGTSHGTLNFFDTGAFTYTPNAGYSGFDEFHYQAIDGTGRLSESTRVRIRVNSPPVAVPDFHIIDEDVELYVPASTGVLSNDYDIDGDPLNARWAASGCTPCFGRVTVFPDGSFRYLPDPDHYGEDEFYYQVRDGVAGFDVGRVTITIRPINDAPRTEQDSYRTDEDLVLVVPAALGVLRNDHEVDGEQLIDTIVINDASHGGLDLQADGAFSYTPDENYHGVDHFRYRVFDETGLYTDEDVEIIITSVNDAPVANDDHYQTPKDQPLHVPAEHGVLANDHDVDGPQISASLIASTGHGEVTLQPDGSFDYQPDGHFVGIDQFQYQIDDGLGELDVAIVSILVQDVDAPITIVVEDDFYRFEGPQLVVEAPGVLANDTVSGAGALEAAVLVQPQIGQVELNVDGGFQYLAPSGWSGVTGFSYIASAGGISEYGWVTLDVQATENVPPAAIGEQFGVLEDGVLDSSSAGNLLANDHDHEGLPLHLDLVSDVEHGTLDVQPNGEFVYFPHPDYNGNDRFTYRVFDGVLYSNTVTAQITVFAQNDAPVALDDFYQVEVGKSLDVATEQGLLANDHDVDGDSLVVELVDAPTHGQVEVEADGSFVYHPMPGFSGADNYRYAASDGSARAVARVDIAIVEPGNHPPIVHGESYEIDEDTVLTSDEVGLLTSNDVDPDGDALMVGLVQQPQHGTLQLSASGEFEYLPHQDFHGNDSFEYTVSDGEFAVGPVVAEITINPVNDRPLARTDLYEVSQNQSLTVDALHGVLANDSDVEGDPLSSELDTPPAHGQAVLMADGSFSYQPNGQFIGRDEFAYRVSDGQDHSIGRSIIDVTQGDNRRPIALGETFVIPEDTVLDTRALESLLANDYDPDGDAMALEILGLPPVGQVEELGDGHIRYTPERDYYGTIYINYSVSDGELSSAPVQVEIILLPVADRPQAQPDLYLVPLDPPLFEVDSAHGVLANDSDPDGDILVTLLVEPPGAGTLALNLDGSFRYTPWLPHAPTDSFRYRVEDPGGLTAETLVDLVLGEGAVVDHLFQSGFESESP